MFRTVAGPERIDRLRIVADHGQAAPVRLHAQQNLRLEGVGVLVQVCEVFCVAAWAGSFAPIMPNLRTKFLTVPSRLLLSERDQLTKDDAITVARVERNVPALVTARDLVERFHQMLRERDPAALPAWISAVAGSVLASFGKGIVADQAAITAAMTEPWFNGQTEGPITKLKLVNRQMYGRAKLDLLRARLLNLTIRADCTESESEPLFHADPQKMAVTASSRRIV